jgi:alpha-N-acetylglucosaminidase
VTKLNYNRNELIPAWDLFINSATVYSKSDGFQYDLVDVTRQVLANYAAPLQQKWVKAYEDKDLAAFKKYSNQYIELIDDLDKLLATRKDFLLGRWIADARRCGTIDAEKALYERNARDLITLWGDVNSPLHEYSCRQWSGLMTDFYKVRWQKFFEATTLALETGKTMDVAVFDKEISKWEWEWVNIQKNFPTEPTGNSVQVAKLLYKKYRAKI